MTVTPYLCSMLFLLYYSSAAGQDANKTPGLRSIITAYCETTKSDSNVIRENVGRGSTGYMVEYTATALYSSMATTVW